MRRRDVLRMGAMGSLALLGASCDGDDDASPSGPDAGADPTCAATEDNIEGPFYTPDAPERSVLVTDEMPGTRFQLTGHVLTAGACAALAGAQVDVWQADANGDYDNLGYTLRGVMITNERGEFELRTIVPGHYLNGEQFRPAHIHIKVRAPGHDSLTTQLYFAGDPYNDADAFIRESLIMDIEDVADGSKRASYDLYVSPA